MGRTSPNDGSQGIAMAGALNDIIEADTAAFMHVDNPYGAGLARKAAASFDGEVTATVPVAKQTSDYSSALDQVFADDPDVFGLIVYPANGESILTQWNRGGYGGQLVMSESMFAPDVLDSLSDIVADAYVSTLRVNGESTSYFEENLQSRMDQDPTTFSHHSFDSAMLIGLAAHAAGEFTGTAISDNIQAVSRPPGEPINAGSDEFERAKGLLDDGEEINYQGASSTCDLSCFYEPYTAFQVLRLNQDSSGSIGSETIEQFSADFFQGKLYTQEQLNQYNCPQ
jgi:ABC-type branched-subunit amino acid transport system substrate-binding protein